MSLVEPPRSVRTLAGEEVCRLNDRLTGELEARTTELQSLQAAMVILDHAVGHDLRGPLMNIGGYADLLRDQASAQLDDKGRLFLAKIIASTARLEQMLTDILALARAKRRGPAPSSAQEPQENRPPEATLT